MKYSRHNDHAFAEFSGVLFSVNVRSLRELETRSSEFLGVDDVEVAEIFDVKAALAERYFECAEFSALSDEDDQADAIQAKIESLLDRDDVLAEIVGEHVA
jgi:hypothetical protein